VFGVKKLKYTMYGDEGKNVCMVTNEGTLRKFFLPKSKSRKNTSRYVKTCGLSRGIRFRCVCREPDLASYPAGSFDHIPILTIGGGTYRHERFEPHLNYGSKV